MAFLPLPVTMMMCSMPDATHSSATYWMSGLSTTGSISLGCALVAGRKRVPRPAAGGTALRTRRVGGGGWALTLLMIGRGSLFVENSPKRKERHLASVVNQATRAE